MRGPDTYSSAYNGLGDRLRQTVNGSPTNYTVDLAAGLTQVLADGTNTYLYGVARIGEEQPGGWQYLLGEALGSVRQLVDTSSEVQLARAYEPFGSKLLSTGAGNSIFGFAGEQTDATGLVYLRARYYGPAVGVFTQADASRFEVNHYTLARQNPVNFVDPSGLFSPDLIARTLGRTSFDQVIADYLGGSTQLGGLWGAERWGWLATLLLAEAQDRLSVGFADIGLPGPPRVTYSSPQTLWVLNCDKIMVGYRDLLDFTKVEVNSQRRPSLIWRDTSASHYRLSGTIQPWRPKYSVLVDGPSENGHVSDLPDFQSIDVLFGPGSVNAYIDRFGNRYLVISGSEGEGFGGLYTEGYVGPSYHNEDFVKSTLQGGCLGLGGAFGLGIGYYWCPGTGASVLTYSIGLAIGYGFPEASFGFTFDWLDKQPVRGWDRLITDRLNGVTLPGVQSPVDGN